MEGLSTVPACKKHSLMLATVIVIFFCMHPYLSLLFIGEARWHWKDNGGQISRCESWPNVMWAVWPWTDHVTPLALLSHL